MLCQSTTSAERDYWNAAAAEERAGKLAAEAVNEMMSHKEARLLLDCVNAGAGDWIGLVEDKFDECFWPSSDVDENWLDETGLMVWKAYCAWCAVGEV